MKEYILDNGIRLIYIKGTSDLISISIALNAGAAQDGEKLGIAHAVEHMIYKGTKKRSEADVLLPVNPYTATARLLIPKDKFLFSYDFIKC